MKSIVKLIILLSLVLSVYCPVSQAVEFGVSGDVLATSSTEDKVNNGFALGMLDFFATERLGEKTRGFIEFVFEDNNGLVIDLERMWVSYDAYEALTISMGRFHTPLGSWNRTYHHGAIVQPTVSRPFFLDFEDGVAGILPVHIIGLMGTGDWEFNAGAFGYELFVANGSAIDSSIAGLTATPDNKPEIEIGTSSDANSNKAVGIRTVFKVKAFPVEIGLFGMSNKVAESDRTGTGLAVYGDDLLDQVIYGIDLRFEYMKFDFLSEFYVFEHNNKVGTRNHNQATADFIQLGYQVMDKLKIMYRHSLLKFEDDDAYFLLLGAQKAEHNVLGLKYELDDTNVIKFEANHTKLDIPGPTTDETTYILQWAFLMP